MADRFALEEGISPTHVDFGKNVTSIHYTHSDPTFPVKVGVEVAALTPCNHYLAKYVIVTVPVGVLERNMITFVPNLFSPVGPMKMKQYMKIFYKFTTRVGDKYNNEFLLSLLKGNAAANNDRCINWQNMEAKRNNIKNGTSGFYLPGSKIWMCTIVTEAFEELLAEAKADGTGDGSTLTAQQIHDLLEPLRRVFPTSAMGENDYVYFYPDLNKRASFGYGAYSNWEIGKTTRDYYKYYGGGPIEHCQHNGCDAAGVWRLHISGAASCFEEWEFVHGAYFAGQRSAKYVNKEMGYPVDTKFLPCDAFRNNFVLPP